MLLKKHGTSQGSGLVKFIVCVHAASAENTAVTLQAALFAGKSFRV